MIDTLIPPCPKCGKPCFVVWGDPSAPIIGYCLANAEWLIVEDVHMMRGRCRGCNAFISLLEPGPRLDRAKRMLTASHRQFLRLDEVVETETLTFKRSPQG